MTPKQKRFVAEYLISGNGADAARRAGYSARTANQASYELMHHDKYAHVQAAVAKGRAKIDDALTMKRTEVLRRLSSIARADFRKLFDENGNLRPTQELDDETASSIAGIDVEELYEGRGEDRENVGRTVKIKKLDPIRALELLGKHHALWNDQPVAPPEGPGMTIVVQNAVSVDAGTNRVTSGARVMVNLPGPE